jgi:hypothetical protein
MDLLKTPHQLLLEEAGAEPATPNLLMTPKQKVFQEMGMVPKLADGGQPQMSVEDMLAAIIAANQTPQKFAAGSLVKNIAGQSALALPFIHEDAQNIAQDIKNQKYPEAAARTAEVGYSAFAPLNPLTLGASLLGYSSELGDATLDAWKKQQEERRLIEQYQAQLKAQRPAQRPALTPEDTRFYKK